MDYFLKFFSNFLFFCKNKRQKTKDTCFCDINIPPRHHQNFSKTKNFFGKIALNLYPNKISLNKKTKLLWKKSGIRTRSVKTQRSIFLPPSPSAPRICSPDLSKTKAITPDLSKNKANSFEQSPYTYHKSVKKQWQLLCDPRGNQAI